MYMICSALVRAAFIRILAARSSLRFSHAFWAKPIAISAPHFLAACVAATALLASPAAARDRVLAFSLTGGMGLMPTYFGSSELRVGPSASLGFHGLVLGRLRLGDPDQTDHLAPGTGLGLSFRSIESRRGIDELRGLADLPAAVELGVRLHHTAPTWQTYAALRRGVTGHRAVVGEIGANAILRLPSGLVLNAGPRAEFADARFMRSYFGVTQAEAARSGRLAAHDPGRGLKSLGFEIEAYQPLDPAWGIIGSLRIDRLQDGAARSPIVQQGRRDQISARLGLTRHFNLRF